MNLTPEETRFLTALIREQNQSGCRGPAHDLLRKHVYPDAPRTGSGSLAFSYDAVPLTSLLVGDINDLEEIDDFVRDGELATDINWPWASGEDYKKRLEEARKEWPIDKRT